MNWNKTACFAMLLLFFLSGFAGVSRAEEEFGTGDNTADFIKNRTYIGAFGNYMGINSSFPFDGTLAFYNPAKNNETNLIPSIGQSYGFGALLGHREGAYACELSYWQSTHTANWSGGGTTIFHTPATYRTLQVDFKRYFFTQVPTQPFISFGIGFPWIQSQNTSAVPNASLSSTLVSSSTLSGVGMDLGAGLEIFLGSDFSLVGGAVQKWNGFNQNNGVTGQPSKFYVDGNPKDLTNLEGDGIDFYVGGTMGF